MPGMSPTVNALVQYLVVGKLYRLAGHHYVFSERYGALVGELSSGEVILVRGATPSIYPNEVVVLMCSSHGMGEINLICKNELERLGG